MKRIDSLVIISRCRFIGISLLIVLSSVSCGDSGSSEDGFPLGSQLVPVNIETSLNGSITQTRGVTTVQSGSIGVFVTTANGYKPQFDVKYVYDTSASGWKAQAPIYVSAKAASLCAYYPYQSVTFSPNSCIATLTAQKYEDSKVMYFATSGGSTICNKTPVASFTMKPAYARVILSIQRHATNYVTGDCAITNVALSTNGAFAKTGTIDISNGTTAGSTTGAYTQVLNPAITIAAGATNATCDLLLPPQPISTAANQGLTIALTVDGVVRTVTAAPSYFAGNKLVPGVRYTISLLITDAEITIPGGVTIQDFGGIQNGDVDAPF